MRHRNTKAKLNKPADIRRAMMRNLMTSLFLYGKVQTTDARAKALISDAEKLISRVKRQAEVLNKIRELNRVLFTENSCKKALDFVQKTPKTSGFTRKTRIKQRVGDGATLIQVDLIVENSDKK
jgi:large subunit ribosomal protein L17